MSLLSLSVDRRVKCSYRHSASGMLMHNTLRIREKIDMAFRRRQRYHKIESFDYKDVDTLRKFINERGKIVSRRVTGLSAKQQRMVTRAVKRARNMALLPFTR